MFAAWPSGARYSARGVGGCLNGNTLITTTVNYSTDDAHSEQDRAVLNDWIHLFLVISVKYALWCHVRISDRTLTRWQVTCLSNVFPEPVINVVFTWKPTLMSWRPCSCMLYPQPFICSWLSWPVLMITVFKNKTWLSAGLKVLQSDAGGITLY